MWSTFSQFSHRQLVAESLPHDTYQLINITWTWKSYTNIANPLLAYSKHLIISPGLLYNFVRDFRRAYIWGVWERGLITRQKSVSKQATKQCWSKYYMNLIVFFFFFTRVRLITVCIFFCCCLQVAGPVNEGGGGGGMLIIGSLFITRVIINVSHK